MFDCFGVMFVPLFSKKSQIPKWPKKPGNRTNMDITLSFLAKSLDKHGVTLVHITYPPLGIWKAFRWFFSANMFAGMSSQILSEKFGKIFE